MTGSPLRSDWWRHAAVYQVYIRSFADGNGDGVGDIAGLHSRLGYIRDIGVGAIWINPWYPSPLRDGGYDIADYREINPLFGTLEEAEKLIAAANEMGIKVLLDLVPNHTSDQHPWFQEALASSPGSEARSRYHFRRGRGEQSEKPPNDWQSVFGGPAWERIPDGDWYLHLFDPSQPDLNWDNPQVAEEFRRSLVFWADRGAGGFRVDVAHGLAKDPLYPDIVDESEIDPGGHPFWDRDQTLEFVEDWRRVLDPYGAILVAEAWVPSWERLARYLAPGRFHQAFNFFFLESPWDRDRMAQIIEESLTATEAVGALPTWVLSNHDVMRHATRYGLPPDIDFREWLASGDRSLLDPERGVRRARAAALLAMALPGSYYMYQGEELGLGEVYDLPDEVLDDPTWERSGHRRRGRDGCRVPIPWSAEGPYHGFGSDGSWLPMPAEWGEISVEAQLGDDNSTLTLYRRALTLRSQYLRHPDFDWLRAGESTLAFRRRDLICLVNFSDSPAPLPLGRPLIASAPLDDGVLPGESAVWVEAD